VVCKYGDASMILLLVFLTGLFVFVTFIVKDIQRTVANKRLIFLGEIVYLPVTVSTIASWAGVQGSLPFTGSNVPGYKSHGEVKFSSTIPPRLGIGDIYWAPARITYMNNMWFEVDVLGQEKNDDTKSMRIPYSQAHLLRFQEIEG
jgi:hypothetical protein